MVYLVWFCCIWYKSIHCNTLKIFTYFKNRVTNFYCVIFDAFVFLITVEHKIVWSLHPFILFCQAKYLSIVGEKKKCVSILACWVVCIEWITMDSRNIYFGRVKYKLLKLKDITLICDELS